MAFDIFHTLDFKKEGLIMVHHNELCDEASDLPSEAFTPTHVCDEPKIYIGGAVGGGYYNLKGSPS